VPSGEPSGQPSRQPSGEPTGEPSGEPTGQPTGQPSGEPSGEPSGKPSGEPTGEPSGEPSGEPTGEPTGRPTGEPTGEPSGQPTGEPSGVPTGEPSSQPSSPSGQPTNEPSGQPSTVPSSNPSPIPTPNPTPKPTNPGDTNYPTGQPTGEPTSQPTRMPYTITNATITPQRTTVRINVQLSEPGIFQCGVYLSSAASPVSLYAIISQGHLTTLSDDTFLSIDGLVASTDYKLFCLTKSQSNVLTTSYLRMIENEMSFTTLCCRHITVDLETKDVSSELATLKVLNIVWDALPASNIYVNLTTNYRFNASKPFTGMQIPFQPTTFKLKTSLKVTSFYAAVPAKSLPGQYYLDFNMSSWDSAELAKYEIVYSETAPKLTVIDKYEPPVPNVSASYFSDDGTIVYIYFDSATDLSNQGFGSFDCSDVVNFPAASTSECVWESRTLLQIYGDVDNPLKVGDTINLIADKIKAKCTNTAAICEDWGYSSGTVYYTITTAIDAVVPTPNIDAATKIGSCDKFVLDLSLAGGSGGRDWLSMDITVTSPNNFDVSKLMDFFNNTYEQSPPTPGGIELFDLGGIYDIDVAVCNFLGKCSTSGEYKHTVEYEPVTRPIAYILGESQSLKSKNRLDVKCVAYVRTCSGDMYNSNFFIADAQSTADLSYAWTVFKDGVEDSSLSDVLSVSTGPELSLDPYSLAVGAVYVVSLEVTYDVTGLSTIDTLDVTVKTDAISAIIVGGKVVTLPLGTSTFLDGSNSLDANIDPIVATGVAAGLSFEWSCFLSSPLDVDDCGVLVEEQTSADVIKITPIDDINTDYANSTSTITLTVFDDSGRRASTATVEVTIVPGDAPIIVLSAESTKILPSSKLKLFSNVQTNSSTVMTWSVDNPAVNGELTDISLTPLTRTELSKGTYLFNLILMESVLPIRGTLTFSLVAGSSSASIDVIIISPPLPGRIVISPAEGEEMSDNFDIGTSLWTDLELPITYAFGYITLEGSKLSLQPRSEDTYTGTTLPAGSSAADFVKIIYVRAFNPLEASDVLTISTVVTKIQATAAEFSNIVTEQLNQAEGETDSNVVKKIVSVASSSMNNVNCSDAPSCSALNRGSCFKLAHTCGECLSSYLGEDGHDNSECFTPRNSTANATTTCQSDSDCALFQECNTTTSACFYPPKSCKFDCNDLGDCVYKNVKTGKALNTCVRGDTGCVARCSCDTGFGGDSCQFSQAEQDAKLQAREEMAVALSEAVASEPLNTPDAVQDLISMIESLSANPYELTVAACESLASMVQLALDGIATLGMQYEDLAAIYQTLDDCQTVYIDNGVVIDLNGDGNNGTRRSLAAQSGALNTLINEYASVVSNGIEGGQDLVGEPSTNFRTSNYFSSNIEVLTFNVAQTDAEIAANSPNSVLYVDLGAAGSDSELSTSLVESVYQMYSSSEEETIIGNPLKASFSRSSVNGKVGLEFHLVNVVGAVEYGDIRTTNETLATDCRKGTYKAENYTCASGYFLENQCADNSTAHHTLTSNCPNSTFLPVCGLIIDGSIYLENPDPAGNISCMTASYTNDSVVCGCGMYLHSEVIGDRRRLATEESNTIEVVSLTTYVADGVVNTVYSVTEVVNTNVWIIITMVVCLWCLGLLLLLILSTKWYQDSRKQDTRIGINEDFQVATTAEEKSEIILSYLDSIFPVVFSGEAKWSWAGIRHELKTHHRHVTLFTLSGIEGNKKRLVTVFELLTLHTTVFFLLGVFFVAQFPVEDAADDYFSARNMIIALLFLTVVHVFVNIPLNILFQDYINAPLSDIEADAVREAEYSEKQSALMSPDEKVKSQRVGSKTGGYVNDGNTFAEKLAVFSHKHICRLETTRRLPENQLALHKKMTKLGDEGHLKNHSESGLSQKEKEEVPFDHLELVSIVNVQREFLLTNKPDAVKEFDEKWGLKNTNLEEKVRFDVDRSITISNSKAMKLHLASKETIGVEIMHEFVLDLLGRDTYEAQIFIRKTEEDFRHLNVVSKGTKAAAWLLVVGLNIFFLHYTISLGINRSRDFQLSFVTVCMIQLFLEVVYFETMEVIWVQYIIPRLVLPQIQQNIDALRAQVTGVTEMVMASPLNVSEFLFVSTRLAKSFPNLFESELVLLFSAYLPGAIGARWYRPPSMIPSNLSSQVGVRFIVPDLVILQFIGTLTMRAQKAIVRLVLPVLLLLLILLIAFPPWFAIPAIILIQFFLLHVYLMLKKKKKPTVIHVEEKVEAPPPVVEVVEEKVEVKEEAPPPVVEAPPPVVEVVEEKVEEVPEPVKQKSKKKNHFVTYEIDDDDVEAPTHVVEDVEKPPVVEMLLENVESEVEEKVEEETVIEVETVEEKLEEETVVEVENVEEKVEEEKVEEEKEIVFVELFEKGEGGDNDTVEDDMPEPIVFKAAEPIGNKKKKQSFAKYVMQDDNEETEVEEP
jgi:hypothetical protein